MTAPATLPTALAPTELKLSADKTALTITFPEHAGTLSAELLRVESPSAEVKGHGNGPRKLLPGKRAVTIQTIAPVGNYAVRLTFSDGHNTGLYTWDYLHQLLTNQDEIWQNYLVHLDAAGLTR